MHFGPSEPKRTTPPRGGCPVLVVGFHVMVPLRAFPQPPSTLGFLQAIPQEGKHLAISSVVLYFVSGRLYCGRAQCLIGDPYYGPCPSRWLCCKVCLWGPDWIRYPRNSGDFPYLSAGLATPYNWLRCPMSGVPASSHRTSRTICDRAMWGCRGVCGWLGSPSLRAHFGTNSL